VIRTGTDRLSVARSGCSRLLLLVIAAITLTIGVGIADAAPGIADAASDIEGVWSFNGGQIAVQSLPNGTFAGTVVAETKFAECTHPVGEQIWTGMSLQPDGSYRGFHQWYFEKSSCAVNPVPGPTAWRVLEAVGGRHYLRVCLSSPGTTQPTIAANGSSSGASFGCINSALTAPLPPASGKAGSKERLALPSAKKCLSLRLFKIHLPDPRYDPFKKVSVAIKRHKVPVARKGKYIVATINLRGLPRGAFTVKIHATTVLGHTLSATRTYHTCVRAPKPKPKHTK
jgi:hypothetical protein